jgi:hypothetical protein
MEECDFDFHYRYNEEVQNLIDFFVEKDFASLNLNYVEEMLGIDPFKYMEGEKIPLLDCNDGVVYLRKIVITKLNSFSIQQKFRNKMECKKRVRTQELEHENERERPKKRPFVGILKIPTYDEDDYEDHDNPEFEARQRSPTYSPTSPAYEPGFY